MSILITLIVILYIYLLGNSIVEYFKVNPFILGFISIYSSMILPTLLLNVKIINFNIFASIFLIIFVLSVIFIVYRLIITKFKMNKINYHILIASSIWIFIYLSNPNFSLFSGNGFDDYYYIGQQNHLIANVSHEITKSFHPNSNWEGWLYVNASICKIFHLDVNLFNKFAMSIVNIIFSLSIFDLTLKQFVNNKYKTWQVYLPLLLIIFPVISFEYWFGSISRLIYRPFYGSSLSVMTIPLLILYTFNKFFKNYKKWIFIILISLFSIVMIHTINILIVAFIIFSYTFLRLKNNILKFGVPLALIILIWAILKIFIPHLLLTSNSNSTFEYWNIMYDFTRWAFCIIYILTFVIYLIKRNKSSLDHMLVIYVPTFIMILFFTGLKNTAFTYIYGFGLQRFLSQLLILICIYFITNLLIVNNKSLFKIYITIICIISALFFEHTSISSGINQQISAFKEHNKDLQFTNTKRELSFVNETISKIKTSDNVLTQHWININYKNDIPDSTYYNYVAHNSCSYNLYSNLSAQSKKNLYYEAQNVTNINTIDNEIKRYDIKYLIISEKYFEPNGFICNENLNYLYNSFAQKHILKVSPDIKQKRIPVINPVFNIIKKRNYDYQELKLKMYNSKFGKIYLFKIK